MTSGRFTKVNEGFSCAHCGADVPPAKKTCRNHCPFCLHSLHVDRFPGDRAANCGGLLRPTGYQINSQKGLILLFKCVLCGDERSNIALRDDPVPDDYDRILALTPTHRPR